MPARKPPTPSKKTCLEEIYKRELQIRQAKQFYRQEQAQELKHHEEAIANYRQILRDKYNLEVPNGKR